MDKAAHIVWIFAKGVIIFMIVALILRTALLYFAQNRIMYPGSRYDGKTEEDQFAHKLIRLAYDSDGAAQIAFYAPPADGSVPEHIWVFYGGNGSKVLDYADFISQPALAQDGFLMIDYPGYGYNQGKPSPAATLASTHQAFAKLADYLHISPQVLKTKLNVVGHSLGTNAALTLAVDDPAIRHVVLIAPFTSMCAMARMVVGYPVCFLVRHKMDNAAALDTLAARNPRPSVTIFNGAQDSIVPPAMGQTLADDHPGWIEYHRMQDAGHIDIVDNPHVAAIAQAMVATEHVP